MDVLKNRNNKCSIISPCECRPPLCKHKDADKGSCSFGLYPWLRSGDCTNCQLSNSKEWLWNTDK